MIQNWLNLIAGFFLLSPLVLGYLRGLPTQVQLSENRFKSILYSGQWVLAYVSAPMFLRAVVIRNPWHIPVFAQLSGALGSSFFICAIAVPLTATAIFLMLSLFFSPVISISMGIMQLLMKRRLPTFLGNLLAAILETPSAVIKFLVFVLVIHLTLLVGHFPNLTQQAIHSTLYQWTNRQVINPLLTYSFDKYPIVSKSLVNI